MADFVGLSYETQQLTEPTFFSASNRGLIEEFRKLSPHGVLRLGGNTSEFGWWKPTPDSPEPTHPKTREVVGEPPAHYYPVTAEAVTNLAAFLDATGWSCLYGINLGTNTPERAAEEAAFVFKTLGHRLQYFQIGNEVDLFDRHLRDPQTWNSQAYLKEWLAMARAVAQKVPEARFGIPDAATKVEWLAEVAAAWPSIQDPPHITTLSHHYYFGGPATNPDVNIPRLLNSNARVQKMADIATGAAKQLDKRLRMTEGNSCYQGGKPGVSDVFAAALWSADYALQLAYNGYCGINLHGGTGQSVANSVGGSLPGDALLSQQGKSAEEIAARPHPFYTPIATFNGDYELQPVGYGLKFAGALSGCTLLHSSLQADGVNANAYAAKLPHGAITVLVINKDQSQPLPLTVDFGVKHSGKVQVEKLTASSLEAREARIQSADSIQSKDGISTYHVPATSAVRLTLL